MIAFVVALEKEAKSFLSKAENLKPAVVADKKAYTCTVAGSDAVVAISGVGKVNAALTTQILIDKFSPRFVFNFGTAGGMNDSVDILGYYTIDKCCQFDFDLRELDGVPLGYIQDYGTNFFQTDNMDIPLPSRSLASADRFTNDENDIRAINDLGCSLRDMEGGAIAQVCRSASVPLYMIKGVSDVYGKGTAQEQFVKNLERVSFGFADVVFAAVKRIAVKIK